MDFPVSKKWPSTPVKLAVLAILTLFVAFITVFSLMNTTQTVFTHFYYVPIILAAYWFDRNGVVYAILLSAIYLGVMYTFSPADMVVIAAAVARVILFIGIGCVIAILSMTISREQELVAESETRFRGIWENIHAGIILVDAETRTIIAANPEAEKLTGFSQKEMAGHLYHTLICPAEQGKYPISDLGMRIDCAECMLLARDGKKVPVLKTVTDMTIGGKRCFIESYIDITPIKDAENTLIAYIREITLRIRNPVELVRDNLHEIRDDIAGQTVQPAHIVTVLAIQEKDMDGILKNLQELERAIAEKKMEIPDALREYMKR